MAISAPAGWPWNGLPAAHEQLNNEALIGQLTPGSIYLLIDPLLGEPEFLSGSIKRYPLPGDAIDALGIPAEQTPFLLELENADDPWLQASMAWAITEHLQACANGSGACAIGGWLQTNKPNTAVDLAAQLGALLRASGAPNSGRYLRLADRRVLALLQAAPALPALPEGLHVPAIDWAVQLQGIACWAYLDHNFALQTLRGQAGESRDQPLRLGSAHWQLLAQAEAINRSLMAWQATHYPLPAEALVRIIPALARARGHGLQTPDDLAAYAAEAMRQPAFESWPRLKKIAALIPGTQQAMSDALDLLRHEWAGKPADHWTPANPINPINRTTR